MKRELERAKAVDDYRETQCLLDRTGQLHLGAQSGFGSMHKTHGSSSQTKSQPGEER